MNHPSLRDIQDYYENESNDKVSSDIAKHIESCTKCSIIIAQIAQVDILFYKSVKEKVMPSGLRQKTLEAAMEALAKRKVEKERFEEAKQSKDRTNEKVINFITESSINILNGMKKPAMQVATILLIVTTITEVARTKTFISKNNLIKNKFEIIYSKTEGDKNENY